MTQTMRERLCRAACLTAGLDPDRKYKSSSDHPANAPFEFAWQEYGEHIDAILAELLKPDAGMREAGLQAAQPVTIGPAGASRVFTAMIDHVRSGK